MEAALEAAAAAAPPPAVGPGAADPMQGAQPAERQEPRRPVLAALAELDLRGRLYLIAFVLLFLAPSGILIHAVCDPGTDDTFRNFSKAWLITQCAIHGLMILSALMGGWPPRDWRPLCHFCATLFGPLMTHPVFDTYTLWIEKGPDEALRRLQGFFIILLYSLWAPGLILDTYIKAAVLLPV